MSDEITTVYVVFQYPVAPGENALAKAKRLVEDMTRDAAGFAAHAGASNMLCFFCREAMESDLGPLEPYIPES